MSTLILLRHGKSDWSGGEPDHLRPLARRGRRQVPEAGRWLADNVGVIDLAVVSPAKRTRVPWRLAAAELVVRPRVREDDRVYAGCARSLLGVLRELPEEVATVVLVGHNPGVEDLVASLTGRRVSMPTSALAVIDLSGPGLPRRTLPLSCEHTGARPLAEHASIPRPRIGLLDARRPAPAAVEAAGVLDERRMPDCVVPRRGGRGAGPRMWPAMDGNTTRRGGRGSPGPGRGVG